MQVIYVYQWSLTVRLGDTCHHTIDTTGLYDDLQYRWRFVYVITRICMAAIVYTYIY